MRAIANIAYHSRSKQPKGFSEMRDLAMLFLTLPELKGESGAVNDALKRIGVSAEELSTWRELVSKEIAAPTTIKNSIELYSC